MQSNSSVESNHTKTKKNNNITATKVRKGSNNSSIEQVGKSEKEISLAKPEQELNQIIISQISLNLLKLDENNFSELERQINNILSNSSIDINLKYWEKLLILASIDIKNKSFLQVINQTNSDNSLIFKLLFNLFHNLTEKDQELIVRLQDKFWFNKNFEKISTLSLTDYQETFPELDFIFKRKEKIENYNSINKNFKKTIMSNNNNSNNNQAFLSQLLNNSSIDNFVEKLYDSLMTLNGENLNDLLSVLLSEILSPGSQNLQDVNNLQNSWFTPFSILEANKFGSKLGKALEDIYKLDNSINWNRIFNLMSTKYFLNIRINPSLSSLTQFFATLNFANLIDQFFNCDWHTSFKLALTCQLHNWAVNQGCFDLLNSSNLKKVSASLPNSKNSLLYLNSIATLNLELFLLRDELTNEPLLPFFQECFFNDFNSVPEYLYLALVNNMKHFNLLIENKSIIDDIIITLLVQVMERSIDVLNDLLSILPNENKLLLDSTKIIVNKFIESKNSDINSNTNASNENKITSNNKNLSIFLKILIHSKKINNLINKLSFWESINILPILISLGWDGFQNYIIANLNVNNANSMMNLLENQIKLKDIYTTFNIIGDVVNNSSNNTYKPTDNFFDLDAMIFIIGAMIKLPLTKEDQIRLEDLQYSIIINFPRIINYGNGHDKAILTNGIFNPISPDVETEMQSYLQKMYANEVTIKDTVDVILKFKNSDNPRDQDVFACITHAILSECSFFKDYPMDALASTAVLFGSMVYFGIFNGFILDVALRKIIEFAKESPESKMFKFAIQAIYAFKSRLNEFPQYCKDLLNEIPNIQTQTQVYNDIVEAANYNNANGRGGAEKATNVVDVIPLKFFNPGEWRSNIPQETPPKEVIENVLFVVNNLTMDNFNDKIQGLKDVLTPAFFSWFAGYLVNQRAKTEPNYHNIYCRIINSLKSSILYDCVVNTTLKQLYFSLAAKDIQNIDKKLLKNLSLWLGVITLGSDRPIRHINVAFRELLLDAYKEGRLEVVIPFVCKVLQNASNSKIFKPPNPWTVGILRLLIELNNKSNWKLSLTFEVEVLFKALDLQLTDLKPTEYLVTENFVDILTGSLGGMTIEQQQIEHQRQGMIMQQYQQHMMMYQQRQQRMLSGMNNQQNTFIPEHNEPVNDGIITNFIGSTIFVTHPELKNIFQTAFNRSLREIIVPAIEKSSNIAVVTASKIVVKDFSTEVDELKLKTATVTMVRQLAKSLARATSIEPLKESIRSNIQQLVPNIMNLPGSPVEELEIAINENIGLALIIIEESAMDRATQEIGEQLMQAVAVRRYHNERRADQPFIDPNGNPYSMSLPEPLGLKTTGVTPQQFRIYEEFGKSIPSLDNVGNLNNMNMPNQAQMLPNQKPILPQQGQQPIQQLQQLQQMQQMQQNSQLVQQQLQQGQTAQGAPVQIAQQQQPIAPPQNGLVPNSVQSELEQNHLVLVHLMDILVAQIKENADKQELKALGEQNQIKSIIFQILTFIARSAQKDQLALKVAQAVVNSLFATSESSLCREVLSLLLEKLCSLSMVARKDVIWWLVYALDSRKFDVPVIRSLLEVNLINTAELDNILVVAMKQKMDKSIEFAMDLLRDVVLSDKPLSMRMDFIHTLEHLSTIKNDKDVKNFLEEYNKEKVMPVVKNTEVSENEKFFLVFTEWVTLLQRVESDNKLTLVFVKQMMDTGILSNSDNLIKFMKASLELSVFSFKESDPTGEVFVAVDALSKLIIKLMVYQDFQDITRKDYMDIICSVIILVFSKDHQDCENFNERPYFRLISNLFFEWSHIRGHNFAGVKDKKLAKELRSFDVEFFNTCAMYLHSLQPFAFPGFSFAWISLISHRMFLPMMLNLTNKAGWEKMMILIIDLFKFLDQYTNKGSLSDAISVVYKGTLRVILGISNDFPDFLIENHYELMNHLPATYFQLRNVILSVIPKKLMIPDPYDINLDMSKISSCQSIPKIFYDPSNDLMNLKKPIDNYLRIPSNSLLRSIMNGVYRTEYEIKNGVGYDLLTVNSKLVRAIVLHVGIEAGLENERTSSSAIFNPESSYYTLLFNMINDGSIELKFQVLQVMIEQLRYPNIHTYWFQYVILHMFNSKEFDQDQIEEIQEIMLRCLLERIVVNKPHPWGVTAVMIQLMKNNDLTQLACLKKVPEVEKIVTLLVNYTVQAKEIAAAA